NRRIGGREGFAELTHVDGSRLSLDQVGTFERRRVVFEKAAGAQQCATSGMAPCSNKCRQTENISYSHRTAGVTLEAVVQANELRGSCRVFLRQTFNRRCGYPGDLAHLCGRVLENTSAKFFDADRVSLDVILIVQPVTKNDVHHSERE